MLHTLVQAYGGGESIGLWTGPVLFMWPVGPDEFATSDLGNCFTAHILLKNSSSVFPLKIPLTVLWEYMRVPEQKERLFCSLRAPF